MSPAQRTARSRTLRTGWRIFRALWAIAAGLLIAALLFAPTFVWTMAVGIYMLVLGEMTGLLLTASAYVMAMTPFAFALMLAGKRFWPSVAHSLWLGGLYAVLGSLFLDEILALLHHLG